MKGIIYKFKGKAIKNGIIKKVKYKSKYKELLYDYIQKDINNNKFDGICGEIYYKYKDLKSMEFFVDHIKRFGRDIKIEDKNKLIEHCLII